MNEQIEYASLTDVGIRRSHNQDAHSAQPARDDNQWQTQGHVFVVADGMGAHAVGELASELAAEIIPLAYQKYAAEGAESALDKAFHEANASIHARGQQNREFQGMGTTSTALVLRPDGAWVGHVGDSRAYRVREGHIEQLSFDHSLLWELAKRQGVQPESVQGVPANVLVRSMGPEGNVKPDVEGPHPIRVGDIYVMCSDGLSGLVTDTEIGAVVSLLAPKEACRLLVDLANLRGGPDNITVIVVHSKMDIEPPNEAENQEPPEPWYWRLPWPQASLAVGGLLAVAAIILLIQKMSGGALCFVLAFVFFLIGIAGIVAFYIRERNRPEPKKKKKRRAKPRVHRKLPCTVDQELLDRLLKAENAVETLLRDRQWEANWELFAQHQQQAEGYLIQEDLSGAYREYCLALRPLVETLEKHRQKSEAFQPNWDKK
ncbi:MAG: protein phosphatase 2C domain-containing protein [Gemmataceae bacterium]